MNTSIPPTLLLVDDEDFVLQATKKYLETVYHFSVDLACIGQEALSKIKSNTYDAIIADFELNGMSGIDLLKIIRNEGNDIPFIIFTGKGREEVVIAAYENGADAYVQKGGEIRSQFADLANRIQNSIEKKRSVRALHDSEQKFRELFNNGSDAVYLHEIRPDQTPGTFIEVNSVACEKMGYSYEEFLNMTVLDLNTSESNQIIPDLSKKFLDSNHLTFECTHQTKDGTVIPFEVASHLFTLHNKKVVLSICRDITERKRAEKEKNAILTGLKDIIVNYVDKDMTIIWANQAMFEAFEFEKSTVGETCYRLTRGRDSPCPDCIAQKAIDSKTFQEAEVSTPDGRHWMVRCNPVIENGVVTSVVHVAINITDRKLAEEALSKSKQQMADIIDFLPDATFVVDKEGTVIAWNKAIEKLTGIHASDMIGKNQYEYSLPFYKERRPILIDLALRYDPDVAKIYSDFQKQGQQFISEAIIADFNGEESVLWGIASPLFDKSGWFIGAIESIRDVTERKRTENALRETLNTLKTVMESIDATVYVCDMDSYEILFVNEYVKKFCGDIIGKKCYETMQSDQIGPCSFCTNAQLTDSKGNPVGSVVWDFQNTLTKRWYHCRDCAIKWIDGRIVRLEIATDITDQKNTESALIETNRQLSLLSGITRHDIRNTITAMQLLVDLIDRKVDISPAQMEFDNLRRAVAQIQSQIEFTQIYQELGTNVPQWQSVYRLISQIPQFKLVNLTFQAAHIDIYADPLLLKVFENLIDNSLRHGETVTAVTISSIAKNDEMILIYEDNGVGISASDKPFIFERGYGKNTGLGLFFIQAILSITNISIQESGEEGKGARFELHIPKGIWRESPNGT